MNGSYVPILTQYFKGTLPLFSGMSTGCQALVQSHMDSEAVAHPASDSDAAAAVAPSKLRLVFPENS